MSTNLLLVKLLPQLLLRMVAHVLLMILAQLLLWVVAQVLGGQAATPASTGGANPPTLIQKTRWVLSDAVRTDPINIQRHLIITDCGLSKT